MNKENVLAVADAIERHSIPDLGFNMSCFVGEVEPGFRDDHFGSTCGTVACIAGWTRCVRTMKALELPRGDFNWALEADWLGLDGATSELFWGDDFVNRHLEEVTPSQAVHVLRHLAETGEVDWSIIE